VSSHICTLPIPSADTEAGPPPWESKGLSGLSPAGPAFNVEGLNTAPSSPSDGLSGLIERVTFHSEETGFAVLRVKVQGRRDLVTVIGSLPAVTAGEWLTAEGRWVRDKDHGLQLKADFLKCSEPTSREGIEKYLGSGLIKGIGPVYAKKLVGRFGEKVFGIIENTSARLEEIDGIGPGRRRKIREAWAEQRVVRDIMVFLHAHGVGTSRATRIYKTYGETAIETVRSNPYLLAQDIPGIGFATADQVARKLGIPLDSLIRARAGLRHALLEATGSGHCALPREELLDHTAKALEVERGLVENALARLLLDAEVVEDTVTGEPLIFLPALQAAEEGIAQRILALAALPPSYPSIDVEKAIAWCEQKTRTVLAASQRTAIAEAVARRVLVITGGPGVGKTTLVNSLLTILRAKKVSCQLCAPTGRAARRLAETTGLEARTIHRLLEYQPSGFARNESRPLKCDLLVVDEVSMVDAPLMHKLLRALPARAHLLLVGDVDQLPSVGPGSALADLIACGRVPVVRLTEIFRQAASSRIVVNAHRINAGQMPEEASGESDFYFVERDTAETIASSLVHMARERIPARLGCDPIRDIQILCPMNRGTLGARTLNGLLQNALNPRRPGEPVVEKFGWEFRLRDKVIQTANNYDKDVFNGDIGQIAGIDADERELLVRFDSRDVVYDFGELDEISLAYAITIHKSQGSEFPVVILPLAMQHFLLLQRNLVYTGLTRGKKLVVLVGEKKALGTAVRNVRTATRHSGLLARLQADR
jgi:exodeoxyribonuclease V alpha subunit